MVYHLLYSRLPSQKFHARVASSCNGLRAHLDEFFVYDLNQGRKYRVAPIEVGTRTVVLNIATSKGHESQSCALQLIALRLHRDREFPNVGI